MERDIRNAKSRIWVEVYIFFNDRGGTRIADALKAKAKEGLDVRVLFDALGSNSTPNAFFNDLAAAGVKVHAFHSLWESFRRFRPFTIFNRRDHRKLMIIDNTIGYFGGMNLIDNVENVDQQKKEDRPTSSGWRDVHVRLDGPHQPELAESFDRSWRRAHHEKVPRRSRAYRRALHLNGNSHDPNNPTTPVTESIRFFDSGPGFKYSRAARVFSRLIRAAQHQITISMAYFIPTGQTLRALLSARKRGVRIRIIVPGKSDVRIVQRATSSVYDKLIRRGFGIYERRQQMLHSKAMVIDDLYTLVGSCNLDPAPSTSTSNSSPSSAPPNSPPSCATSANSKSPTPNASPSPAASKSPASNASSTASPGPSAGGSKKKTAADERSRTCSSPASRCDDTWRR